MISKKLIKYERLQSITHCSTVLSKIVRIFPKHEFQALTKKHHVSQKFRSFSRWSQYVALLTEQLASRSRLRDVVDNIGVQVHKKTRKTRNSPPPQNLWVEGDKN
jgi:hypothetical protein